MATKTFKIGLSNTDKQNMAQDIYERVINMSFDEYDSANTYNTGDFVVYENPADTFKLYECNSDNVTGAWDSSKWDLATFQNLVDDIESAVAFVNDKANVDGNYPTMTVGVADQLSPYDDESGDDQDQPFSFQATGTGNGSQPDFSTGSIALMKEKQGNSVVVNNQFANGDFASTTDFSVHDGTFTVSGNVGTFTAQSSSANLTKSVGCIVGHTYLFIGSIKLSATPNGTPFIRYQSNNVNTDKAIDKTTTNWQTIFLKATASGTGSSGKIIVRDNSTSDWVDIQLKNFIVIDLTQMFNGDIPQDLLDNPESFFHYYQGSLAYNEGELVNADGRYIKCIGRNQFDEQFVQGSSSSFVVSKNTNKCIGGLKYYVYKQDSSQFIISYIDFLDKDGNTLLHQYIGGNNMSVTAPNNVYEFKLTGQASDFSSSVTPSDFKNITISLYYEGESGYDQYYPYEVLTNTDTGTETLRSAGSVKDYKTPDGTVHRRVGYVDLGSLNWTIGNGCFTSDGIGETIKYQTSNLLCARYVAHAPAYRDDLPNGQIMNTINRYQIAVKDSAYNDAAAFKTAMSGVYLFYELAEPTTEQGTSYSENLVIDDFGSMDFQGTNGVPQGNLIFYPVDYKAFIDTLYNYTEGTPSNIALKSDLDTILNNKGYYKIEDFTSQVTDIILDTSYLKVFKCNKIVTISLDMTNQSGSDIAQETPLFKLPASITTSASVGLVALINGSPSWLEISSRGAELADTLPNNAVLLVSGSFVIN